MFNHLIRADFSSLEIFNIYLNKTDNKYLNKVFDCIFQYLKSDAH